MGNRPIACPACNPRDNVLVEDPRSIYDARLAERRARIAAGERRHRVLGYWQLAAAAAGAALVWMALVERTLSILWVLAPLAAFVALVAVHDRLLRSLDRRRRAARFFERGLARLTGEWAGTGEAGEAYRDASHPYAEDLDLFGKASLFELLCTARTHIGEETLARWLKAPAPPAAARARQQAVNELRPRLDLREQLAVLAEEARTGLDPESLAAWGEAAPPPGPRMDSARMRLRLWAHTLLGIAALVAFVAWFGHEIGTVALTERGVVLTRDFLIAALFVNSWFFYRVRPVVQAVVVRVEEAAHELALMSEVLVRLERERFATPLLAELRASLDAEGEAPSRRLARLNRLVEYIDSRDNFVVKLIEPLLLWTAHCSSKVEAWRGHSGPAVRRWLAAMGEMEALCSLASHAFEHPADPFPEFAAEGPCLEAEGIGHPLIAETSVVRNDARLDGGVRLLVVSGSNMSGKSTLLRTLGINCVLAQAGAPVRARRMRLSPLAVGASIRVQDSLQTGVSRFYAEILRLRQILDLTAGPVAVLFLIDEFLHGTNSHDRRIGAEALVRRLVERGAIGLITTHDLALADIVEGLAGRAANVHFEDRIEDGRILFDYAMRPGVVRKSNAIELMRSVGLKI